MIELERRLRRALKPPLPGLDAQLRMAPAPRIGWDPLHPPSDLRDAAALVLVYPLNDLPHVLLTVRGAALRKHTGQISLPGGSVDEDESIESAALREASEEVGVLPSSVHVIGRLTPLQIPISGYLLHPVVGVAEPRPIFRREEWEVARILEVPLTVLRDPSIVRRRTQPRQFRGQTIEMEIPYFDVGGEQVWGATAMVLAEFLAVLESAP
ncbi:MAG TPA: CoA pyrophosphatase [Vicinamibacterales bacterium]|nr:CoA pyrophosphatase [Vicinamibacterales bacterium]